MAAARTLICALVWILSVAKGKVPEARVTCLFSEDCVLPCTFKPAGQTAIHWTRQEFLVHDFLNGSDWLDQQHAHYSGRTSLFPEQIANGNASLQLRMCNTQDRGRYRCHVTNENGNQEYFVIVKVEAPVRTLALELTRLSGYEEIKCSARDVYPAPHVWWATDPPTPPDSLKPTTRKMATQNGLYSVESKLRKLPAKPSDGYTYFCTVNSSYDTESWRASLREKELSGEEGGALTVPCHAPTPLENFTLTWAFSRADEPEDIFTFDSRTGHTSNRWAGLARVDQNHALSGDGSLHLQNLRNKDHTGTYTCNFSAPRSRHLEHTCVNITVLAADRSLTAGSSWLWVIAILLAALALFIAALILFRKMKAERSAVSKPAEATEMQAVQTDERENGISSESSHLTKDQTANEST